MSLPTNVRATDPAILAYHATLQQYADHRASHEGATETAFSHLLAVTAKPHGWTLIPKKAMKVGAKTIYPDGTLQDGNFLRRGYWEAKDTNDDLDSEIRKKREKGYPLTNTIFEDTTRAVLFQNGLVAANYDLRKAHDVAGLLTDFYRYTEPDIEGFDQAVDEFRDRVPELAEGLKKILDKAHKDNPRFQTAFDGFFTLCQTALNPNIRREAVDEMLVQHLLTERLFRKIFHDDEFTKRNVIAAEVETVIAALVSKSFSRADFLKALDKFYKAIEAAAETIDDFADKQHFLNTVYERFFQGYSVKTADTHGIVYTPQPIVDFMCASVVEVLKTEFGLTLGSKEVKILDPCTGTGNFIVNLMRRVPKKNLPEVYKNQLFANEVMLLPYYIAALNIEHAYGEITGSYEPFEGLCFADTLDLTAERQPSLFSERNTERVERQKFSPITVVIGNPPYNVGQLNENDNNKNRKYESIDDRIKTTYVKDSKATLKTQLYDPYVKFFRWATDRLKGRDGLVCFVSNNSFVEQFAFDGMRKHLLQDFSCVYHLHLEGNVRENPKFAGTAYNVFGIQVGVGITIAIKSAKHKVRKLLFHRIDKMLRKEAKWNWLTTHVSTTGVKWELLTPDDRHTWLVPENAGEFDAMMPIGSKKAKAEVRGANAIFRDYCRGAATNADAYVYDYDRNELTLRAEGMVENFNTQMDRWLRNVSTQEIETFLAGKVDEKVHKWIRKTKKVLARGKHVAFQPSTLRNALYRPFVKQTHLLDRNFNEDLYSLPYFLPNLECETENRLICIPGAGGRASWATIVTNVVPNLSLTSLDSFQCFPFYVYDEDGTNRQENITDWALKQFRTHYKNKTLTKWDIFYYVYGLLHHPAYRTKFADNLKRDLPRIPFAPDYRAFAAAGKALAELHLNYEDLEPFDLQYLETPGVPLSYAVEKMKLSKDKTSVRVNESLTLVGIPPEVFEYRLGNRSALDWMIDQYRVTEDKRSGIRSDPNRTDDTEYIVKLIGRVIAVSVATVRIVKELPVAFAPA